MTSAPTRPRTVAEITSRLCARAVEFRAAPGGDAPTDGRTLEGYAAVFDTPTLIESYFEGSFNEVVARGAFRRTLGTGRMPVLQFDHGRDARTGSVPIGAVDTVREDKTGLFVSARLFENDVVEPIRQAIAGGAINGMSFRFRVIKDAWTDGAGDPVDGGELLDLLWDAGDRGPLTRTIQDVDLLELGPVVFPAYEATSVGVRSLLAALDADGRAQLVRDLADMLRNVEQRTAVAVHHTATVDTTWDAGVNEARLDSPMKLATAKDVYAWYDADRAADGEIVKDACSFPHHEVSEDGTPGAANLHACRNGLARLTGSNVPASEQDGVKAHLQAHLDDGESKSATPADDASDINDETSSSEPAARTSDRPTLTDPAVRHSVPSDSQPWLLSDPRRPRNY